MKIKLLPKFVISLVTLGVVLTLSISLFSYTSSKKYYENAYAERVLIGSKTIAEMLSEEDIKTIIAADGDQTETYREMYELMNKLKEDNEVTYLSLVVPDEDSVTFYIDTCVESMGDLPENQIPYASDILYTDAANGDDDLQNYHVIWDYYSKNEAPPMPLVTDNSYGYNYTAVCPILDENGKAIAEIQYILDMKQVRQHLNSILYMMFGISFGIIAVGIVFYILFVRKAVTNPLGKLAQFTQDITLSSEFHKKSISINTGDEIEELGNSFNYMLEKLDEYLDNLQKVTAEKERIGAELDVAAKIQADMLPCIFPAFPERKEFDIFASMTPAKEVGGDFYDFFLVDSDHLAIVIADVSGKGVPAALFMVIAKTLLKDHTQAGINPAEVFSKVNQQLCESNDEGMFVTAWMGVLEISTRHMTFVNAGHNPPLLRKGTDCWEYLKQRSGFVLAGMEGMRYKSGELQLSPGDTLYLYTDGVTEAANSEETLLGEARLKEILDTAVYDTCEQLLAVVKNDVEMFVGDEPQFDDITMLALKLNKGRF